MRRLKHTKPTRVVMARDEAQRAASYTKGMENTAAILAALLLDCFKTDRIVIPKSDLDLVSGHAIAILPGPDGALIVSRSKPGEDTDDAAQPREPDVADASTATG